MKEDKKIEHAEQILDRIINFVTLYDSKASISIGFIGIVLTIFLTSDCVGVFYSAINQLNLYQTIISYIILILTLLLFLIGLVFLFKTIIPNTNSYVNKSKKEYLSSYVFFGEIKKYSSYNRYAKSFRSMTDENYLEDLMSQIYSNAIICDKKNTNYKKGMFILVSSCSLLSVLILLVRVFGV